MSQSAKKPIKLQVLIDLRRLIADSEAQIVAAKNEKRWREIAWLSGYNIGLVVGAYVVEKHGDVHATELTEASRRLVVTLLQSRRSRYQDDFDRAVQQEKWSLVSTPDGILNGIDQAMNCVNGKIPATAA